MGYYNRHIGVLGGGLDYDAARFIMAAGITNATQQSAVNTLVISLKAYGLWTKFRALYPFVGGTATTNKYNLKDPRDLDAAFRLVYFGTSTHTNGFNPNGTNGYADTFYIQTSNITFNDEHISVYSSSNNTPSQSDTVDIGSIGGTNKSTIGLRATGGKNQFLSQMNNEVVSVANTDARGFFVATKTSAGVANLYKNGALSISGASNGGLSTLKAFIGTINLGGLPYSAGYTNQNYTLVSFGSGLSATDIANFYTLVQAYQTTLSRNV